jgi:hypothetical protein
LWRKFEVQVWGRNYTFQDADEHYLGGTGFQPVRSRIFSFPPSVLRKQESGMRGASRSVPNLRLLVILLCAEREEESLFADHARLATPFAFSLFIFSSAHPWTVSWELLSVDFLHTQ